MSRGRPRLPELPEPGLHSSPPTGAGSGCDIPATPLPELSGDLPDGTGGGVGPDRGEDADLDRAADAFFRADAERRGYIAPDADGPAARRGLNAYYRDTGLMPDRAYRLIGRYEVPMSVYEREGEQ